MGIKYADFVSDLEIEKVVLKRVDDYSYRVGDHLGGGTKDSFCLLPEPPFDPRNSTGTQLVDLEFEKDLPMEHRGFHPRYETKRVVIHGLFIVFEKLGLNPPEAKSNIRTVLIHNVPNGCPDKRPFDYNTEALDKFKNDFLVAGNKMVDFEKAVLDILERNILLRHAVWVLARKLMNGMVGDFYSHPDLACNIGGVCQTLDLLIRKALDEASEIDKHQAYSDWISVLSTWTKHRTALNLPSYKTDSGTLDGTSFFWEDPVNVQKTKSPFTNTLPVSRASPIVKRCASPVPQLLHPVPIKTERPKLLSLSTEFIGRKLSPPTADKDHDKNPAMNSNNNHHQIEPQDGYSGHPWHLQFQHQEGQQSRVIPQHAQHLSATLTYQSSFQQQGNMFPQPLHQPVNPQSGLQQQSLSSLQLPLTDATRPPSLSPPGVFPPPTNSPFAYGNPWSGPNPYAEARMYVAPNLNRPKSKLEPTTAPNNRNTPTSLSSSSNTVTQPQQGRSTGFQAPSRSRCYRTPSVTAGQEPVNRHLSNVGASHAQAGSGTTRRSHAFAPSNPSPLNQVQGPASTRDFSHLNPQLFLAQNAQPATPNPPSNISHPDPRSFTNTNVGTAGPASFYQAPSATMTSGQGGFAGFVSHQKSSQSPLDPGTGYATEMPSYGEQNNFEAPAVEDSGYGLFSQSPVTFINPWEPPQTRASSDRASTASSGPQSPFGSTRASPIRTMTVPTGGQPRHSTPHAPPPSAQATFPVTPVHQITPQHGSSQCPSHGGNQGEFSTNPWVSPTALTAPGRRAGALGHAISPTQTYQRAHQGQGQSPSPQGLGSPFRNFESDVDANFLSELSFEEMISLSREQIEAKRRSYSQRSPGAERGQGGNRSGSEGPVKKKSRTGLYG